MEINTEVAKVGICQKHGYPCSLVKVRHQLDLFRKGAQVQWRGICGLHLEKPDCTH